MGEVQCLANPSPLPVGLVNYPEDFLPVLFSVLLPSLCSSHFGSQLSRRKIWLEVCRREFSVSLSLVGQSVVLLQPLMLILSDRKCKAI